MILTISKIWQEKIITLRCNLTLNVYGITNIVRNLIYENAKHTVVSKTIHVNNLNTILSKIQKVKTQIDPFSSEMPVLSGLEQLFFSCHLVSGIIKYHLNFICYA